MSSRALSRFCCRPPLTGFRHRASGANVGGFSYKAGCASRTHWRTHHYGWLDSTIGNCTGSREVNLSLLLRQLKHLNETLALYGVKTEALDTILLI